MFNLILLVHFKITNFIHESNICGCLLNRIMNSSHFFIIQDKTMLNWTLHLPFLVIDQASSFSNCFSLSTAKYFECLKTLYYQSQVDQSLRKMKQKCLQNIIMSEFMWKVCVSVSGWQILLSWQTSRVDKETTVSSFRQYMAHVTTSSDE